MCSNNLHMLHLRGARYSRSVATSTTPSATPLWAAYAREAPSAPNRTPPLAIYVRRFALFLFWRWFSIHSLLFSLASRIALDIAISQPLISWVRACSIGLNRLYKRYLRQRLSRAVYYYSLAIL